MLSNVDWGEKNILKPFIQLRNNAVLIEMPVSNKDVFKDSSGAKQLEVKTYIQDSS